MLSGRQVTADLAAEFGLYRRFEENMFSRETANRTRSGRGAESSTEFTGVFTAEMANVYGPLSQI